MTKKGKDSPIYGLKRSEETKKKLSESKKGKNHPRFSGWYCLGRKKYASAQEAEDATGQNKRNIDRWAKRDKKGWYFIPAPSALDRKIAEAKKVIGTSITSESVKKSFEDLYACIPSTLNKTTPPIEEGRGLLHEASQSCPPPGPFELTLEKFNDAIIGRHVIGDGGKPIIKILDELDGVTKEQWDNIEKILADNKPKFINSEGKDCTFGKIIMYGTIGENGADLKTEDFKWEELKDTHMDHLAKIGMNKTEALNLFTVEYGRDPIDTNEFHKFIETLKPTDQHFHQEEVAPVRQDVIDKFAEIDFSNIMPSVPQCSCSSEDVWPVNGECLNCGLKLKP